MAYTKTTWETGQVISATLLNHAEDGIKAANDAIITGGTITKSSAGEVTSATLTKDDGTTVTINVTTAASEPVETSAVKTTRKSTK